MKFTLRKLIWLGIALAVGGMWFVLTAKTNYLSHKSTICIS